MVGVLFKWSVCIQCDTDKLEKFHSFKKNFTFGNGMGTINNNETRPLYLINVV